MCLPKIRSLCYVFITRYMCATNGRSPAERLLINNSCWFEQRVGLPTLGHWSRHFCFGRVHSNTLRYEGGQDFLPETSTEQLLRPSLLVPLCVLRI